jgi:hypothetical protein
VARVSPNGNWRSNIDEICEELDAAGVKVPKAWKQNRSCRKWTDCTEPEVAIKVIEYRLKIAKSSHEETFS